MKNIFTDFKGEQALDLIANLIEPITVLAKDTKVTGILSKQVTTTDFLALSVHLLKNRKKEVIQIISAIEGVDPKDCQCTVKSIFNDINTLVKLITEDEELAEIRDFFFVPREKVLMTSSGNVMENTTEIESK